MSRQSSASQSLPRPDGYVTYAVFTRPSAVIPGGEALLHVCATRDIAALDIPADAFEVYFCDAPPESHPTMGRDPLGHAVNQSKTIFIASEIISREELQDRLLARGIIKSREPIKAERDADGNLKDHVVKHGVWLAKTNSADFHAIGRFGNVMPIRHGQGNMVIDADKNILMDADAAMPRALMKPVEAPPRMTPPRPRDPQRYKL